MARAQCACIQVDGPHHWLANSRAATGETLGRRRLLAARGWAVVSVPYFAWPTGGVGEKQAYMHAVRFLCPPFHTALALHLIMPRRPRTALAAARCLHHP